VCSCWVLRRLLLSLGAPLRWLIGGVLRHPVGLKGSKAAAPPLQRLCLLVSPVRRSKWSVPGGAVAVLHRAGIDMEVEEVVDSIAFYVLFQGSLCKV
jgi:hypothetical protein